jgi:folate-binding protein YgfZ
MSLATPLIEAHQAAGAEIGAYFGTRLPARFGDFAAEYRAGRESVALVDANFRALFSFSGPDRHRYLNAVLTSNVRDLAPGQGAVGLLLTPQGHILAEIETYADPDRILALSHASARESTHATLEKFIIMDDVTLEDLTEATGTLLLAGPRAAGVIAELAGADIMEMPVFSHFQTILGFIPCRVIRLDWLGHAAAQIIAQRAQLLALWEGLLGPVRALKGAPAGMEAVNSLRLEAGIPWFGYDFDEKHIPHEAGLDQSHINYEKGCYTGQEIVERVRSRGSVSRRLAGIQFFGEKPPAPGTKLLFEGAEAGHVTSAGFSPRLGRPIGLGYIRREHSNVGRRLDASGIPAERIALPLGEKMASA